MNVRAVTALEQVPHEIGITDITLTNTANALQGTLTEHDWPLSDQLYTEVYANGIRSETAQSVVTRIST